MIVQTAKRWLAEADFQTMDQAQFDGMVERVGYDKACEVRAALQRVSENTLDALGSMMMSEDSLLKLIRAVSSIVVDTYLPMERNGE